jgi:hypothetical protein
MTCGNASPRARFGAQTVPGAARVIQVFAYAVCFLTAFGVLTAAVMGATALIEAIDPQGGFSGGRDQALSTLLTSVVIAGLAGLIFRYTWSTFELGLKPATPTAPPPPTTSP